MTLTPVRLTLSALAFAAALCWQLSNAEPSSAAPAASQASAPKLDRTGKVRRGKASYYHRRFAGKTMANGEPMNPNANIAASKTLPLGTEVLVQNTDNGRSTVVTIEDRGPYVKGRIIDVAPKVADDLGMKHEGVAPVVVAPITVPMPDGSVKPGAGAASAARRGSD